MISFRRKRAPEPGSLAHEHWKTSFKWYQRKRLPGEETPSYRSTTKKSAFTLRINKQGCLAWVTSPLYRYRDFSLQGRLSLDENNGYSAVGFVLRYINEENFYYFLVSNKGYFRFDLLFNKNVIHLIEWTELPGRQGEELDLSVLVHGSLFAFYLENDWVGEVQDEAIPEGYFGLIAQNYYQRDLALASCHHLSIDSRPLEVEKAYYRWVHYVPAPYEHRIRLARTFFAMGRFPEATVQLKKALRTQRGKAEDFFLLAESFLNLKMYDRGLASIEQGLKLEPQRREARLEKANLLYLLKRFLQARDYIRSIVEEYRDDAPLWNLLGNCEYSLGNWSPAGEAYGRAADLEPDSALYRTNLARVRECLQEHEAALLDYLKASRLLFRQEDYAELALVLPRARDVALKLQGSETFSRLKQELQALEGKMLYHEGSKGAAQKLFGELIEAGYEDSAVYFLYGLIYIDRGKRRKADEYLSKAAELDDQYPLYWFRLAENRYLADLEYGQALEKAFQLNPDGPWVNNLYGLTLMKQGGLKEAEKYFLKALAATQAEGDIYANYADLLLRQGKPEAALEQVNQGLAGVGERAKLLNQRGNIRAAQGNYADALQDYERALRLAPEHPEYQQNCAACCLELDMIMRGEELLRQLLERHPSAAVYNLNGNLSMIKGEFRRAELSYREGLKLEEKNQELKRNLAALYLDRGQYQQAKTLIQELVEQCPDGERTRQLQQELRQRYELRLDCSLCGRQWWAPRQIPPQGKLRVRGEPPAEAPAGRCTGCGKVYCVGCVSSSVQDRRLICPRCGQGLRLSDDYLKYLLLGYIEQDRGG